MNKYYDEFATNCEGCGWLKSGEFPDGTPYLACGWFGTIMHKQSDAECSFAKSKEYVAKYMAERNERKRK